MAPQLSLQTVLAETSSVVHVRVVVHTMGAAGPNTSDNHWSIYLIHPDRKSHRVNMRADFDDIEGKLEWTKHAYAETASAIAFWDFPAVAGLTVSHIAHLLDVLGRGKYMMSGGGSGCRWWVYTVMNDLAQRNYVHTNAPAQLWPNLLYLYHKDKERIRLNMVRGEFY